MLYKQYIEEQLLPDAKDFINEVLHYPFMSDDINNLPNLDKYEHLVIIGTGGSTIGGQTLTNLIDCNVHYAYSLNSDSFSKLFNNLPLEKTCFVSISKSGNTSETLALTMLYINEVEKKLGKNAIKEQFIFITMTSHSPLRKIGEKYECKILEHPENLGGRFSILSLVGLIPAKFAGLDIEKIRAGANLIIDEIKNRGIASQAIQGAIWQYNLINEGYSNSVIMPYVDKLHSFTLWYKQIWAESLGKEGKGSTPLNSIGTFDQHSQLQLFLDGPRDKIFTLINVEENSQNSLAIPLLIDDENITYLNNKTLEKLNNSHFNATITTLENAGCAVRKIILPDLKEENIGALLMSFMIETIITSRLLKVNPFDQPAVEEGKKLVTKMVFLG